MSYTGQGVAQDAADAARNATTVMHHMIGEDPEKAKRAALACAFFALSVLDQLHGSGFEFFQIYKDAERLHEQRTASAEVRA